MSDSVEITTNASEFLQNAGRPVVNASNPNDNSAFIVHRGLKVNSYLRKDEWEALDTTIVSSVRQNLRAVNLLVELGLTRQLGGPATLTAQWNSATELGSASVSMHGQEPTSLGQVNFTLVGAPVPVVHKGFSFSTRLLEASRRLGDSLDMTNAASAAYQIAYTYEDMLINGNSSVVFGGDTLFGLRTQTNRNTGSGGDWGTITNITTNVNSMIAAVNADGFYGPFVLLVNPVQFNEAAQAWYTDGSGQTAYQRVISMPSIARFDWSPLVPAGEAVLFQATPDVVQWAEGVPVQPVEWMSGDASTGYFRVYGIATPLVKSVGTLSGIAHYTGI